MEILLFGPGKVMENKESEGTLYHYSSPWVFTTQMLPQFSTYDGSFPDCNLQTLVKKRTVHHADPHLQSICP